MKDQSSPCQQQRKTIPFLKWAGGKRWLASDLAAKIGSPRGRYIEPFLGSGAVFFSLEPQDSLLGDLNSDLVETYKAIQSDWESVRDRLVEYQFTHSKENYYIVRGDIPDNIIEKAARFIYLNRTCWNGLYRVNLAGKFNVPIGTKASVLLETDDFNRASDCLKGAKIFCGDFELLIDQAEAGDVLFADPPYTVRHKHNGFVKYNESLFSWNDQVRLRDALLRAKNRGAAIYATNADHESIRSLYEKDFSLVGVERYSAISGKSSTRGKYPELIIEGLE